MNMNQFTQKSLEAIQSAQNLAVQHGNQQIEQPHLLLALVEQEGGFIPQLLTHMGLTVESFRAAVRHEVEILPKVSGAGREADKVYIDPGVDKAMNQALAIAGSMKDEFVSVEHLFLALLDTGNTLSDPISGRPVLVAQRDCVAPLLPAGLLPEGVYDPAGFLAGLADESWRSRFRLLPYRAVGVAGGLLLALRVDEAQVGGRSRGASLVALSPSPVSDGGAYTALVGVE